MALTNLQQISIRQETTEGSAVAFSSLFSAALTKYLVIEPSLDFEVSSFERNIKRNSLTRLQSLTGTKRGTCRFTLEIAGDTTATAAPAFGLPLQACGFRQESLTRLTIGTITGGPFLQGEIVTQATSGAKGMVVKTTYNGETTLWVAQGNGLGYALGATTITAFTITGSHTLTGGTSGATCAEPSAVTGTLSGTGYSAPAGFAWFPWSYSLSSLTTNASGIVSTIAQGSTFYGATSGAVGQYWSYDGAASGTTAAATTLYYRRVSGTFASSEAIYSQPAGAGTLLATLGAGAQAAQFQIPSVSIGMSKDGVQESIKAARGTCSFVGRIGEPMLINFEFQGGVNENSGAMARDNGNVTGITPTTQVPPVLLDADITFWKSGTALASGYGPCITNLELNLANEIGFRECMADAAGIQETILQARNPTITLDPELVTEGTWDFLEQMGDNVASRARFVVGSAAQNQFSFNMPGVSWTTITTGDRNGVATRQLQGTLHGGSQSGGSTAQDNELVIIYPTLATL